MKIHRPIIVIRRFFARGTIRYEEKTHFVERIMANVGCLKCRLDRQMCPEICTSTRVYPKIIDIHRNYEYWNKRIKQVEEGRGYLSLRYWSVLQIKPKLVEFTRLTNKEDGVGIQKLVFEGGSILAPTVDGRYISVRDLSKHFGLRFEDFKDWFKDFDLNEPLAIIHLTRHRY